MQSVQELFFVLGSLVKLFTVMIWLNVQQERNVHDAHAMLHQ